MNSQNCLLNCSLLLLISLVLVCCCSSSLSTTTKTSFQNDPEFEQELARIYTSAAYERHTIEESAKVRKAMAALANDKYKKKKQSTLHHQCMEHVDQEDGTIAVVLSERPGKCSLANDHRLKIEEDNDATTSDSATEEKQERPKRAVSLSNTQQFYFFVLPSAREPLPDDSYVRLEVRMCAQPGAELSIRDLASDKILDRFRNRGTAYQCNRWIDGQGNSIISDTNQVQVEYRLPVGNDAQLTTDTHRRISATSPKGSRTIQYESITNGVTIFSLEISYHEVPFLYESELDPRPVSLPALGTDEQEPITVHYQPNWVRTYSLGKRSMCEVSGISDCQSRFFIGISVEIEALNLDFDRGDYLLIGPGGDPDFWPGSASHMIASRIQPNADQAQQPKRRYWIQADSGFLRIVTHNSLIAKGDGQVALRFKWTPANETLDEGQLDAVSPMLKEASIKMCAEHTNCLHFTDIRPNFVDELVSVFNNYMAHHDDEEQHQQSGDGVSTGQEISQLINSESVHIFDQEPIVYHKIQTSDLYCQFQVAISSPYDSEYPLVSASVLRKIIFGEDGNTRRMIQGRQQFNNCVFQRISWATILVPIAVIVLVTAASVFAFWRIQYHLIKRRTNFRKLQQSNHRSFEPLKSEHQPSSNEFSSANNEEDALQY